MIGVDPTTRSTMTHDRPPMTYDPRPAGRRPDDGGPMSPDHNGDGRSLGQLFASATAEMSALVHDEIALAKAELRQDAKRAAIGSGALVVALTLAVFAVPMFSFACAYGIHALGITMGWSY